jgi:hypothetical protein
LQVSPWLFSGRSFSDNVDKVFSGTTFSGLSSEHDAMAIGDSFRRLLRLHAFAMSLGLNFPKSGRFASRTAAH